MKGELESLLGSRRQSNLQQVMTQLLETALAQLKILPNEQQDAIAALILAEIEGEARWNVAFAQSQDVLADLAAEAMAEYRAGQTQVLNPETLYG